MRDENTAKVSTLQTRLSDGKMIGGTNTLLQYLNTRQRVNTAQYNREHYTTVSYGKILTE